MDYSYYIRRTTDRKEVLKLDVKLFNDEWFPEFDKNLCWLVRNYNLKNPVGYACGRGLTDGIFYLSRAGVLNRHRGKGLHKRLIAAREVYARKAGYKVIITYVAKHNVSSWVTLVKRGYEVYQPEYCYAGKNFLYFRKGL